MNTAATRVPEQERVKIQQTLFTRISPQIRNSNQPINEKFEGSPLVLTTAGTDLDSTDTAAVHGELKKAQPWGIRRA